MERNMFKRFAGDLKRLGADGVGAPEFSLGREGQYDLQYIPFEHLNRGARLVIVGITPGNTQLELAYEKAQELLKSGWPEEEILVEIKKVGAFGGSSMKPNLLKLLRHFQFEKLLGIDDVDTLWGDDAELLHSSSVVPHAAFKAGKRFNGSFEEVIDSPLLKQCFLDCFVPSVREMGRDALFVALGPCPQAALEWCLNEGVLLREQVLGSFCHPSSAGGSATRYYLREVTKDELNTRNPVRSRCEWLDQAYEQMRTATSSLLGGKHQTVITSRANPTPTAQKPPTAAGPAKPSIVQQISHRYELPTSSDISTILGEVERAGYRLTKTTAKLSEFQSPSGQTIYLVKTTSKLNSINLMVHPRHKPDVLREMDGVDSVSDKHRFHSNMTEFPKRLNKGETETAFGWQLSIETLADLPRFLSAFNSLGLKNF